VHGQGTPVGNGTIMMRAGALGVLGAVVPVFSISKALLFFDLFFVMCDSTSIDRKVSPEPIARSHPLLLARLVTFTRGALQENVNLTERV